MQSLLAQTSGTACSSIAYWPKVQAVTAKATSGPIIYFRAENGNYTYDGNVAHGRRKLHHDEYQALRRSESNGLAGGRHPIVNVPSFRKC